MSTKPHPHPDLPKRGFLPGLFLLALSTVTIFALLPAPAVPSAFHFWDKLQHGLAYTTLTLLGGVAFPRRLLLLAEGLTFHGAAIEFMQGALTTTRHADPADWVADCVGIVVGLFALAVWRRHASATGASTR